MRTKKFKDDDMSIEERMQQVKKNRLIASIAFVPLTIVLAALCALDPDDTMFFAAIGVVCYITLLSKAFQKI